MKAEIIEAYKCGICKRKAFAEKLKADNCCQCDVCGKPKGHTMQNTECDSCRPQKWAERSWKRLERMETIPYMSGMVLNDDNEKYFFDDDSIWCWLDSFDCAENVPDYLLICRKDELNIDASDVAEHYISDDHYEDAMDNVGRDDLVRLQLALDEFCKSVKIVSWYENSKEKVSVKEIIQRLNYERFDSTRNSIKSKS